MDQMPRPNPMEFSSSLWPTQLYCSDSLSQLSTTVFPAKAVVAVLSKKALIKPLIVGNGLHDKCMLY